jgi:small subunit ribosomal protein S6
LRHYELVVVLSPILSQEEAAGEWDRIKSLVHQNGDGGPYEERWGMRRLAYPIRRAGQTFLEGNYLLTRFSSDTVAPPELEAHLRLSEAVIRYLLTKAGAPESTPPSPQMLQMARAAEIREQQAAAAPVQEAEQTTTEAVAEAEAPAGDVEQPVETAAPEASAPEEAVAVAEEPAPVAEAASEDAPVDGTQAEEAQPAEDTATAEEPAALEDTEAGESRQDSQ